MANILEDYASSLDRVIVVRTVALYFEDHHHDRFGLLSGELTPASPFEFPMKICAESENQDVRKLAQKVGGFFFFWCRHLALTCTRNPPDYWHPHTGYRSGQFRYSPVSYEDEYPNNVLT
jgi:hypothetical protein